MRQRFPPPLKTSQYWFSKESWTCTPMKQWAQRGVNGETAGEFQVSHSRMFHEQFVHDAKVTNGWIYDLYIWTTPPIFSKAGYHRNAWNLYKMFEQRQNQSRRVSVSTGPRLFSHLSCPFGQSLALRRKTLCFGPSKGFCLACEAFLTSFWNHSTWKPKLVFFRR